MFEFCCVPSPKKSIKYVCTVCTTYSQHVLSATDTHTREHIREQIITLRDSLKYSLSHQSPSLLPPFPLSSVRSPCPQTLLRILIHHPLLLFLSLSLRLSPSITHFLYWILIGCLLRGLSFKSLPPSSSLQSLRLLQKNSNIKEEIAEVNAVR